MPTDRADRDDSDVRDARGDVPAPGDITRGTEAAQDTRPAATPSEEFAERQSFADPAHKPAEAAEPAEAPEEGGIRTQESGNQEGGHTGPSPPAAIPDVAELARASEEEE